MNESKNLWEFNTRQIVYGAIGAALYGVFSYVTNILLPLPAAGNISFRPAVAVLMLFGAIFGPWVGFIAGLLGNVLGDAISGYGFWWHWSLGNGIMGLVVGLAVMWVKDFRKPADIAKAVGAGIVGILIGMLFASLVEIAVSSLTLETAIVGYWVPAIAGNIVVTVILLPILMVAYAAVLTRRSR